MRQARFPRAQGHSIADWKGGHFEHFWIPPETTSNCVLYNVGQKGNEIVLKLPPGLKTFRDGATRCGAPSGSAWVDFLEDDCLWALDTVSDSLERERCRFELPPSDGTRLGEHTFQRNEVVDERWTNGV